MRCSNAGRIIGLALSTDRASSASFGLSAALYDFLCIIAFLSRQANQMKKIPALLLLAALCAALPGNALPLWLAKPFWLADSICERAAGSSWTVCQRPAAAEVAPAFVVQAVARIRGSARVARRRISV